MARFRAKTKLFIFDKTVNEGQEFEIDLNPAGGEPVIPSYQWEPLDSEAKAAMKGVQSPLEKARAEIAARSAVKPAVTVIDEPVEGQDVKTLHDNLRLPEGSDLAAIGQKVLGKPEQQAMTTMGDGKGDADKGGEGNADKGKELSPSQRQKAVLDALATIDHKDDSAWTTGGEVQMKHLEEKVGFNLTRAELKEMAPDFVRQQ